MTLLRTLALAGASAVLLMGQAVAAFAHPQHEPSAVSFTAPARSATAKYHSLTVAKKARLFDLGRYRRNHLHRRAAYGCHGSALRQGRSGEEPCDRCRASRSTGLCTRPAWAAYT